MFRPSVPTLGFSALCAWALLATACGGSDSRVSSAPQLGPADGQLGDRVWLDADRDGIQDIGETGQAGVKVTLETLPGGQMLEQTTDGEGRYLFTGLRSGTYVVRFEIPAGFDAAPTDAGNDDERDSDGQTVPVVLVNDPTNTTVRADTSVDFGLHPTIRASLGDFVWHDLNCNGLQDRGEPGLDGVRVVLKDATGNIVDEEITGPSRTGGNGHYLFEPLPAGEYSLEVDPSTLPPRFVPAPCRVGSDPSIDSDCSPSFVRLASDRATDTTVDFGFCSPCTGTIGDFIWFDFNGDGCQDPGEPGLARVRVLLKDVQGVKIAETWTDGDGLYLFRGLCAGDYLVEIDPLSVPECYVASPVGACSDPNRDSSASPAKVTLQNDTAVDRGVDFGLASAESGRLSGRVWDDLNGDGLQDPNEPSLTHVRILLRDAQLRVLATAFTSAQGYAFSGLCAGEYTLEVDDKTLPAGATPSPCNVGSDPTRDSECSPVTVTLGQNQEVAHLDFGYGFKATGAIGDFVWNDYDVDGIQDPGEPGMSGIRIVLMDAQRQELASTLTNQYGHYQFDRLRAGSYRVELDPTTCPPGFRRTKCGKGPDRGADSNCRPAHVELSEGEKNFTIDFGLYSLCYKSVGDFVWLDTNGNGLQDPGEPGIESVTMILRDNKGVFIATCVTNHRGEYKFEGICPGNVVLTLDPATLPPGLVPTKCGVGSDRSIDSECAPHAFKIGTSQGPIDDLDFGFVATSSVGDNGGRSSAYWADPSHFGSWPVSPNTSFGAVFGNQLPGRSLLDVLSMAGGDVNGLARDTVAAYLNAVSQSVVFPLTTTAIEDLFGQNFAGDRREQFAVKKFLETYNKRGFPRR